MTCRRCRFGAAFRAGMLGSAVLIVLICAGLTGCKSGKAGEKSESAQSAEPETLGPRPQKAEGTVNQFLRGWRGRDWSDRDSLFSKEIPEDVLKRFFEDVDKTSLTNFEIHKIRRGTGVSRDLSSVAAVLTRQHKKEKPKLGESLYESRRSPISYLLVWEGETWKIRKFDPDFDREANERHFTSCMNSALDIGLAEQIMKERTGEATPDLTELTGIYRADLRTCRENLRVETYNQGQSFRVLATARTIPECDIEVASNSGGLSRPIVRPSTLDECLKNGRN